MFFKNITVFKLLKPIEQKALQSALVPFSFKPCSAFQAESTGWIHPFIKDHNEHCHQSNHFALLCLKTEEKILPTQVINQHTDDKIIEIETLQNTKVGKHKRSAIKEDVTQQLLSKAFSRFKCTYVYFDFKQHYLIIDSNSDKAIETVTGLLRKSLGSLTIELLLEDVSATITSWLKDDSTPQEIVIEDQCKLITDQGDGVATITCQGNTMLSENIMAFIEAGGQLSDLALSWRDQLRFILNDRFQCKSIKFLEGLKSLNDELAKEDAIVKQEADFLLMAETFGELIGALYEYCKPLEMSSVSAEKQAEAITT